MLTLLAPAKINVTLEILTRRSDGYHTLRSVMLPIALYDRIDLQTATGAGLRASDPALESDNLVTRALVVTGLARRFDVVLHKGIPVGGGLGGGSSDAAAILRAAMDGSLGERAELDWLAAAARLGSDVPFFLCGTGALVEGTGERVTPLGALPEWWVVVVRPRAVVSTGEAYRRLDESRDVGRAVSRPRASSASLAAVDAVQRRDFSGLVAALVNDFHEIVSAAWPPVARAAAALRAAGGVGALVSGSGSCVFALCERESEARAIACRIDAAAIESAFAVPLHREDAWR